VKSFLQQKSGFRPRHHVAAGLELHLYLEQPGAAR